MPEGKFELNSAGAGRRFMVFDDAPLAKEAFAAFGFDSFKRPDFLPNFVGNHFQDGAFVHPHTDTAPTGYVHVRCNWMLKKPKEGGDPIFGTKTVAVSEGDLWVCFASEEKHSSTPISGGERLVCSFGGFVPLADVQKVLT